jgi:CheY-like chemotaxis protein
MAKTLLLADDSVTIQKVVGISFASEDVALITVDNGDDAIAKAQESRPDAILADVVMPGKSGYEVCEAIKADPALQHIPVLLLTGTFESFDEERAQRCGAAGHVAKPFEAQTLVEQVRALFAQAAAAPPSAPPAAPQPIAAPAAPEPIAAAAPASTPEQAPASPSGESFDFFDDDLGDLTPAEPAAVAPESGREEADALDSDGAFAFGDEEREAPQPEPLVPSRPVLEPEPGAPLDRTVAILPDELEAGLDAPAPPPTELDASLEPAGPRTTAEDLLPAELEGPAEPVPQPADDFFDFDIGGSSADADSDAAPMVRSEDLAEATVFDPKGALGYDVSSSDLGDPLEGELFDEALPSEDSLAMPVFGEPLETDSQTPSPATESPAPQPFVEPEPEMMAEPVPAPEPVAAPEPAWPPEPAAAPEPVEAPEPAWPPEPAATAFEVAADETPAEPVAPAVELDESSLEDLVPPAPAGPAEEPQPLASAHDAGFQAADPLEQIAPRLREQLHDTLEKIAWESFGDVTEQIVRTALERVEQIAWEVIPEMAETLIREEIRRMKGETES